MAYLRAAHVLPRSELGGVKLEADPARVLARVGAVDRRASNGADQPRDDAGRVLPKAPSDSTHGELNRESRGEALAAERARAINRAPEPVGIAWDAGLVSTRVAVQASGAGPEVGAAVEGVIRERGAPKDDGEKKVTKKAVDDAVRATLTPPSDRTPKANYSSAAARDTAKVALYNLKRAIEGLRGDDGRLFRAELAALGIGDSHNAPAEHEELRRIAAAEREAREKAEREARAHARHAEYWEQATRIARQVGDEVAGELKAMKRRAELAEQEASDRTILARMYVDLYARTYERTGPIVDAEARDGEAAVRHFGLDPSTATRADINAAFNKRALEIHPDAGGARRVDPPDMDLLVKTRDAARAYVARRDGVASERAA